VLAEAILSSSPLVFSLIFRTICCVAR
jgi:hypothetical protein